MLVPLAGQSHDVAHLAWRGHSVVAVEGVPAALDAFKATYGADEARRIAGHACDDYDGDDVRGALATMHVVRLPAPEGGSKRLTWHAGDFLGNFSCPPVWKSTSASGAYKSFPGDRAPGLSDKCRYVAFEFQIILQGNWPDWTRRSRYASRRMRRRRARDYPTSSKA